MVNVLTAGGVPKVAPDNTNGENPIINDGTKDNNGSGDGTMQEIELSFSKAQNNGNDDNSFVTTNINTNTSTTVRGAQFPAGRYTDDPSRGDGATFGVGNDFIPVQGIPDLLNTNHNDNTIAQHHHTSATTSTSSTKTEIVWLFICFIGIMASFVAYGLLLEYTTSGGRKLHELSFLFITSGLYTVTAAAGRYVRDETPTTIPPARFAILGLTSMGSTFCSVRSLRYVIYPIQVLAKSCKPVPVMLFGAVMGKKYPARKYFNVALIVGGVALFMGGGDKKKKHNDSDDENDVSSANQLFGLLLLFISLCFDGGTGAYEDKLMSVHSVQPFDLMYNIQLGKTILAGVGLIILNQMPIFIQMIQEMGFLLVALGLTGALGQVFIFITIAKFGALTCSIIGLARKVTTLVASILYFGHHLSSIQFLGLVISVLSMVMDFFGKSKKGGGHGHSTTITSSTTLEPPMPPSEELKKILAEDEDDDDDDDGNIELGPNKTRAVNV